MKPYSNHPISRQGSACGCEPWTCRANVAASENPEPLSETARLRVAAENFRQHSIGSYALRLMISAYCVADSSMHLIPISR
jgi:hypothetical protein